MKSSPPGNLAFQFARNSSLQRHVLLAAVAFFLAGAAVRTAQGDEKPFPSEGDFHLESGNYRITISPELKYNLASISFKGESLTVERSYFGATFSFLPDAFAGGGHQEDGIEELSSVELSVNGEAIPIEGGKNYSGEEIVLTKTSLIRGVELSSKIVLDGKGIRESRSIRTIEPFDLHLAYFFMYPWNTDFDSWAAETENGDMISGAFANAALEEFVLRKDVLWSAVYNSDRNLGVVISFPKVYPGSANRSTYWKRGAYHKYYFSPKLPPAMRGGFESEVHEIAVSVFSPADPNDWVQEAAQIASVAF